VQGLFSCRDVSLARAFSALFSVRCLPFPHSGTRASGFARKPTNLRVANPQDVLPTNRYYKYQFIASTQ
jgi:hypothetical protein